MKNCISYVLLIAFLSSCVTNSTPPTEQYSDYEAPSQSALFAFPLPTSLEVSETLLGAGADYISTSMNSVENAHKYVTTSDKALNLGIYTADICYAITYEMKQDAIKYISVAQKMLDELGIVSPFSEQIMQGFNDDNQNKDSILIVVNDSFKDTYAYLKSNNLEYLNVLVISGSFIEGLYILTTTTAESKNKESLMRVVAGQKNILNEILKLIEPLKEDNNVKPVYSKLMQIKDAYQDVKFSIDESQFEQILKVSKEVRNSII